VQRGLLRWFLSLHSLHHSFSISPERIGGSKKPGQGDDDLPSVEDNSNDVKLSFVPAGTKLETEDLSEFPPAFTSSVKKLLKKAAVDPGKPPTPLPGLDIPGLKSRLDGKKKIK
jgi:DNA-3-methyladenine glycosylase II